MCKTDCYRVSFPRGNKKPSFGAHLEVYEKKIEITEEILMEAFKCRTWAEIKCNGRCETTYDLEGNKTETWFYGNKKILSVRLVPSSDKIEFEYKKFI